MVFSALIRFGRIFLDRKIRTYFFWISFTFVIILPIIIGFLFDSNMRAIGFKQYEMLQNSVTQRVGDHLAVNIEKLAFVHSAALYKLKRNISINKVFDSELKRMTSKMPYLVGLVILRNNRIIKKSIFADKNYNDKLILDFNLRSNIEVKNNITGITWWNGDFFMIKSPLNYQRTKWLVTILNAKILVNVLENNFPKNPTKNFFAIDPLGRVIFNDIDRNYHGDIRKFRKLDFCGESLYRELLKSDKGIKTFKSKNNSSDEMIVSWKKVDLSFGMSCYGLIFVSKNDILKYASKNISKSHFLLIIALVTLTIFIGSIYYKTRKRYKFMAARVERIPALKQNIDTLESVSKRYTTLFDAVIDGIVLLDDKGLIVQYNSAFADLLGVSDKELKGTLLRESIPLKHWANEKLIDKEIDRWGYSKNHETEYVKQNGNIVSVEVSAKKFSVDGIYNVILMVRDITTKKSANKKLIKLNKNFEGVFESNPASIITINDGFMVESINKSAEKFFVVKREIIRRQNLLEQIPFFKTYQNEFEELCNSQMSKSHFRVKYVDGNNQDKYLNLIFYPILNKYQRSIVISALDITESVNWREQLLQTQKMEAMGRLTSGFAHDFNNLLGGMFAYLSILTMKLEDGELKDKVKIVYGIAKEAASLVSNMVSFSKKASVTFEILDVSKVLNNVLKFLSQTLKKITLKIDIANDNLKIEGEKTQLFQVFLNLIINARDAMPVGGEMSIKVNRINLSYKKALKLGLAKEGDFVKIDIIDEGEGIPEGVMDKIFEPFYTTKGNKKGSGMGLTIVYGILKSSGGVISVKNNEGKGSTFTIYFPEVSSKSKELSKPANTLIKKDDVSVKGSILIVDDEEVIAEHFKVSLEGKGHTVTLATTGEEAIELFKENHFDLIFLDMVMPGLSGEETFDFFKKINPDVRVVIQTGHTDDESIKRMMDNGVLDILHKPFSQDKMHSIVVNNLIVSNPKSDYDEV